LSWGQSGPSAGWAMAQCARITGILLGLCAVSRPGPAALQPLETSSGASPQALAPDDGKVQSGSQSISPVPGGTAPPHQFV
jgi:hypothetical protein